MNALQYAAAICGNHAEVASDYHRPIINGYIETLRNLSAELTLLRQERDRLSRRVDALEAETNPQDVSRIDAGLTP